MKFLKSETGLNVVLIFAVLLALFIGITEAMAVDVIMSGKLTNVTQKISKNGEPYVIIALTEAKELNGVKYNSDTSIFCFKNEESKKLKTGDSVKFVAKRTVDKTGNEFVTLVQFIK
jgi:Cu/Ag efflux protein CusF